MKTAEQIKAVIEKLTADLESIQSQIEDLRTWREAGQRGRNDEFFVAQADTLKDLQKQEWQAEYRIRAYKWVLEEK